MEDVDAIKLDVDGGARPPLAPASAPEDSQGVQTPRAGLRRKSFGGGGLSILGKVATNKWEKDADLNLEEHSHTSFTKAGRFLGTVYLAFQALGVVYGDIGTSPLYTFAGTFAGQVPDPEDILGAASLIVYSLTLLVLIKYSLIVLRADDHGNGGTFALYSILKRAGDFRTFGKATNQDKEISNYRNVGSGKYALHMKNDWRQRLIENKNVQRTIRILVVFGVGAIMGDGVLTPAITVLSACEGIQVASPSFTRGAIVGIALAILVGLFFIQRFGTGTIGLAFSPIVFVWLTFNAVCGVINIVNHDPAIFRVFGPNYWVTFFTRNGVVGWRQLGGILLCITGAEALYADLGHFNRQAILLSTTVLVYPCLILTYLGQAAYLTKHPQDVSLAFWNALPRGTFWPMFVIAFAAAVVASQAMISAVFQIVYQAIAQDFFPRFQVVHTSPKVVGQVYIPVVNFVLMVLTIIVVAIFQKSEKLGQAYGLAVIGDMLLTTQFMTLVMVSVWRLPIVVPVLFYLTYLIVEGSFLSAAVEKIPRGGWFSLLMAGFYASIMLLWFAGTRQKRRYIREKILGKYRQLSDLLRVGPDTPDRTESLYLTDTNTEVHRCPGVGLYYGDNAYGLPPVLVQHLKSFPIVHQVNVLLTNRYVPIPHVRPEERILVNQLGVPGFYHAIARYGYLDRIDQGHAFIEYFLEERVLRLLYQALFYCLYSSPALQEEVLSPAFKDQLGLNKGTIFVPDVDSFHLLSPKPVSRSKVTFDASQQLSVNSLKDFSSNENTMSNATINGLTINPALLNEMSLQYTVSSIYPRGHPARRFKPIAVDLEQQQVLDQVAATLLSERAVLLQKQGVDKLARAVHLAREIDIVRKAKEEKSLLYVFARSHMRLRTDTNWLRKIFLELPYEVMVNNVHDDTFSWLNVPEERMCEVGLLYQI